ncbi:MAG: hypothetical protein M1825_004972 [Sarcosagium campestre]|nr:MAG: hypothetical protein M1825_004972 [Sarcosagium campestre]
MFRAAILAAILASTNAVGAAVGASEIKESDFPKETVDGIEAGVLTQYRRPETIKFEGNATFQPLNSTRHACFANKEATICLPSGDYQLFPGPKGAEGFDWTQVFYMLLPRGSNVTLSPNGEPNRGTLVPLNRNSTELKEIEAFTSISDPKKAGVGGPLLRISVPFDEPSVCSWASPRYTRQFWCRGPGEGRTEQPANALKFHGNAQVEGWYTNSPSGGTPLSDAPVDGQTYTLDEDTPFLYNTIRPGPNVAGGFTHQRITVEP